MMLDMKRTFDDIVLTHTDPGRAEQIFANPFYVSLSSSFAGTQEYMAMEKLGQLKAEGTLGPHRRRHPAEPVGAGLPRRAAAARPVPRRPDDPDADRAGEGRRPGLPEGVHGRASKMFTDVLNRILGAQALKDLSLFVASLETMFGGFRERADQTYQLLKEPGTSFVVVAVPERDALREAAYFVERLETERMPLAGLVAQPGAHQRGARAVGRAVTRRGRGTRIEPATEPLAAAVLRVHAERLRLATRDGATARRSSAPRTRACRSWRWRRRPATSTTSKGCGRSASSSPERASGSAPERAEPRVDAARQTRHATASRCVDRPSPSLAVCSSALPGLDVRAPAQQGATLALGQAAPHAELDPVVEGVGEALGANRAPAGRPTWRDAGPPLDEQLVRAAPVATGGSTVQSSIHGIVGIPSRMSRLR